MGDGFGKALARQNRRRDLADGRAHPADVDIGGEQVQRVVDARSRAQQQGEVASEDRHVFGARPREQRKIDASADLRAALFGDGLDRN